MKDKAFEYNYRFIKKTVPEMRYDEKTSFDKWQTAARKKLYELLGLEFFEKCNDDFSILSTEKKDEYTKIRFTFQTEPGLYIPCVMLLPETTEKRPVMICLQGHSTGMHNSFGEEIFEQDKEFNSRTPDRAIANEAAKRGYIAIAMEQRYMGELGGSDDGEPSCVKGNSLSALLVGRCTVGERVWDVSRLIDVIEKHIPGADSDNISCMGGSVGGTTTFYAACIDERIKMALPNVAICTFSDSIAAMHHCGCNYIPGIARYFDMGDLGGLIAPRKLLVSSGKEDPIFPINGARECAKIIDWLYKCAKADGKFIFLEGNGGHQSFTTEIFRKLKEGNFAK